MLLKTLHVALAYLTVLGFTVRALWSLSNSPLLQQRWVKIVPHAVDTLLLTLGVIMALQLSVSVTSGWLLAKLLGLLAYIGCGVVTLRATSAGVKLAAFVGALLCIAYIFSVAFTRSVWPW